MTYKVGDRVRLVDHIGYGCGLHCGALGRVVRGSSSFGVSGVEWDEQPGRTELTDDRRLALVESAPATEAPQAMTDEDRCMVSADEMAALRADLRTTQAALADAQDALRIYRAHPVTSALNATETPQVVVTINPSRPPPTEARIREIVREEIARAREGA